MTNFGELVLNIGLYHYLFLALVLFLIGFWGAIISKNMLKVFISLEFMLTAVNINFIAFVYRFFNNETFIVFFLKVRFQSFLPRYSLIVHIEPNYALDRKTDPSYHSKHDKQYLEVLSYLGAICSLGFLFGL